MKAQAVLLALSALVASVRAHGGGLHDWAFSPEPTRDDRIVVRQEVAKCGPFQPLPLTEDSVYDLSGLPGVLPVFPNAAGTNLEVSGDARLWWYLGANCSASLNNGLEVQVNMKLGGQPYAEKPIWGYVFTGNCSAPGDLYRNNATKGDDRFNLVFFRKENYMTTPEGDLWGTAAGSFLTRLPGDADFARSLVLYPLPGDSLPMCCEFQYPETPALTQQEFIAQGQSCKDDTHGASGTVIQLSPSTSPSPESKPSPSPPPKSPVNRRPPPRMKWMYKPYKP